MSGCSNNTPLHEASLNGDVKCIQLLFNHGADQMIRNNYGVYPRDLIKNSKEIINLFDEYKAMNPMSEASIKVSTYSQQPPQTNELDKSQMKSNRKSIVSKKPILISTNMSDSEKENLRSLGAKLGCQTEKQMGPTVTHLVFNDKVCPRSITYMKAIAMGIWIVSIKCKLSFF
jgi:hypothetical protein